MHPIENTHFLVVDDHATARRLVIRTLNKSGYYTISEAENGMLAIARLTSGEAPPVEVVILDCVMPQMGGLEVLKNIRDNPDLKDLPVLMVTAEADTKHIISVIKAGVSDYIVKPFEPMTFMKKLNRILEKIGT